MKYIFTKCFFELSPIDQAALVDAAIREIEYVIGQGTDPDSDRKARRRIARIRRKALECGIWEE